MTAPWSVSTSLPPQAPSAKSVAQKEDPDVDGFFVNSPKPVHTAVSTGASEARVRWAKKAPVPSADGTLAHPVSLLGGSS